jgi:hypothetical protein
MNSPKNVAMLVQVQSQSCKVSNLVASELVWEDIEIDRPASQSGSTEELARLQSQPGWEEEPQEERPMRLFTPEEMRIKLERIKMQVKTIDNAVEDKTVRQLQSLGWQLDYLHLPRIQHASLKLRAAQKDPAKLRAVLLAQVMAMEAALNLFLDPELKTG